MLSSAYRDPCYDAVVGRRAALAFVAIAALGCQFSVPGFPVGVDGSAKDGAPVADASHGPGFVPSHVSLDDVVPGASSLAGAHDIDTEQLQIDGAGPAPGILFAAEPGHDDWAVLSVRDFNVTNDLRVHGRRALVVIAVGSIEIGAKLHAGAEQRTPGPGGQFTGQGAGSDGKHSNIDDSGGGGAGHATVGAAGGDSMSSSNGQGGAAGGDYSTELAGGSGGGAGAGVAGSNPCPPDRGFSLGGAGGGVVQLSAGVSISVLFAGVIDAGGGGGRGGCKEAASAGGGGGSGGSLWLEAPTMNLAGTLTANGGAGGAGGRVSGTDSNDGQDGQDGHASAVPAAGGSSAGMGSGAGGNGGVLGIGPQPGEKATNGGGGGGAYGRIRLRTRAAAAITGAQTVFSPAPDRTVDF